MHGKPSAINVIGGLALPDCKRQSSFLVSLNCRKAQLQRDYTLASDLSRSNELQLVLVAN